MKLTRLGPRTEVAEGETFRAECTGIVLGHAPHADRQTEPIEIELSARGPRALTSRRPLVVYQFAATACACSMKARLDSTLPGRVESRIVV